MLVQSVTSKSVLDPESLCTTTVTNVVQTMLYQLLHANFYVQSPDGATTGA